MSMIHGLLILNSYCFFLSLQCLD